MNWDRSNLVKLGLTGNNEANNSSLKLPLTDPIDLTYSSLNDNATAHNNAIVVIRITKRDILRPCARKKDFVK